MSDIFELFGFEEQEPTVPPPKPPKVQSPPKVQPPKVSARVEPTPPAQAPPVAAEPRVQAPLADVEPPAPRTKPTRVVRHLDCGHMNWQKDEKNEQARAEGLCCANQAQPISWPHLKGVYARPLPMSQRRSAEKDQGFGFPGYCCDEEGWYIGGLGNDCRFFNSDERRCSMHKVPSRQKVGEKSPEPVVEVIEPEVEVVEPDEVIALLSIAPVVQPPPVTLPVTGTWKQRQMQRRK